MRGTFAGQHLSTAVEGLAASLLRPPYFLVVSLASRSLHMWFLLLGTLSTPHSSSTCLANSPLSLQAFLLTSLP